MWIHSLKELHCVLLLAVLLLMFFFLQIEQYHGPGFYSMCLVEFRIFGLLMVWRVVPPRKFNAIVVASSKIGIA